MDIVERVNGMYGLPVGLILGSYGGGDSMQVSRPLYHCQLPACAVPEGIHLQSSVDAALSNNRAIAPDARVANLPDEFNTSNATASVHFQVSSHVYGESSWNAMYHGWLFQDLLESPDSLGGVSYPLIGIYSGSGIKIHDIEDVANIGLEKLTWSEQHVHTVSNEWHLGPNMAKFGVAVEQAWITGWFVCVDTESNRINYTYVLAVRGDLEDTVDRAILQCHSTKDVMVKLSNLELPNYARSQIQSMIRVL